MKEYPKVLVIGLQFGTSTGGGITLTNLFKDWPADKLAAAAEDFDALPSICRNNYQLGYLENKRKFPFYLIQKKKYSGVMSFDGLTNYQTMPDKGDSRLKRLYLKVLRMAGLFHYSRNLRASEPFRRWVTAFQPDYIYNTANELEVVRLVKEVQTITRAKIVTHLWDDLIKNYFNSPGLFYNYRKKQNDRAFKDLLDRSSICLCISEAMKREYYERYGKSFQIFHNCLNLESTDMVIKNDYRVSLPFTILYAGRVGMAISSCLMDVCRAIEHLGAHDYEFRIQTTSSHHILSQLARYPFVKIGKKVDYEEIPAILAAADLLLLPYNFDDASKESLKLSMPTKLPEYMLSGSPILLYSDKDMYVTEFGLKNHIAYVVSENTTEKLAAAIRRLRLNEPLRRGQAERAAAYARTHFSADKTREQFTNLLTANANEVFADS